MSGAPDVPELPRDDTAPRDGIGEEDNRIPPWFNVSFAGTIVFGVVYSFFYIFSDWSSAGQYLDQVAAAEARSAAVLAAAPDENPYRGDAQAIQEGEQVFLSICAACHKPDATGLVGPSLVDTYTKYGESDESLFQTVANGRPAGMPPWKAQLGADKIWKVLAYIETLPRSDAPGVGAPGYAGL